MTAEVGGAEAGAAHGTGSRPPRCNPDPQVSGAKKKKSGSDALGMVDCLLLFSITCFIAGAYSVTFNNGRG